MKDFLLAGGNFPVIDESTVTAVQIGDGHQVAAVSNLGMSAAYITLVMKIFRHLILSADNRQRVLRIN